MVSLATGCRDLTRNETRIATREATVEHIRRKPNMGDSRLRLETLEARLNLSALHAVAAPAIGYWSGARNVGAPSTRTAITKKLLGGAATTIGGATAIPVGSYSAIYNSQVETVGGQQDIGYVSTAGSWVEYTVTAPSAGAYTLGVDLASPFHLDTQVSVNGVAGSVIDSGSTGGWQNYVSNAVSVRLNAGTNVIRFSSLDGTQYNLANVSLKPATATALLVGDNTSLPIAGYTNITGSKLEYVGAMPDIGYVSTAGATVDYSLNVGTAGTYSVTVGASSVTGGMTFDLRDNGTKLASYKLSNTGGWQTYGSFSQTVTLPAGVQTLEIAATNGSQYNLQSIKLVRQGTVASAPSGGSANSAGLPTTVPTAPATSAVSVSQRWMTSFTELDISETAASTALTVSQSGSTFTINSNGYLQTVTGAFGDIVIYAGAGNASVIVDSSVSVNARIYAGSGSDVLKNLTRGQATIVTLDGGSANVTGNGINTAYWVTPADTVNASATEKSAGDVHTISNFYQPSTSTAGAAGYDTNTRDGENITDPTSAGNGWTRLTTSSLWGTGPTQQDVNQGFSSDCYFLSTLSSLAQVQPGKLEQMAVDLGDGTFAVQFVHGNKTTFVRVDADLPTSAYGGLEYARTGTSGDEWALIMEKAYAYYRSGANSYASLDWGFNSTVYSDLGINNTTLVLPTDQNSFFSTASAKLSASKGVDILTNVSIASGVPLVESHCYSVTAITKDSGGTVWVTMRNPWGYDGFNVDSNPGDGFVTLQYSTLLANATFACLMT